MNTNLYRITQRKQKISTEYPQNTVRKNYFLSACQEIDDSVSLDEVDEDCVYGDIIGIEKSKLVYFLIVSKILRLHAVLHDASGYMKARYETGKGYCYAIPFPDFLNCCFFGHVTGLVYCLYIKTFYPKIYREVKL